MNIPILFHSFKGTAEEIALVDSSTTEIFIDQELVTKLKLGTRKLEIPVPLRNIDGTYNRSGCISQYLELLVSRGNKKQTERFYVTNLGSDRLILGYPWLRNFNPDLDWANSKLIGPAVCMETLFYRCFPCLRELMKKQQNLGEAVIPTQ